MNERHPWPPPPHASGCIVGFKWGETEPTPRLSRFHYADPAIGSKWGFCTERYATHGRQTEDHGPFEFWAWDGPAVPSAEEQGVMTSLVWDWANAPGALRALSPHGGDEDLVALVPKGIHPDFLDRIHWADPSEHELEDGRTVYIWAHS